MALVNAQLLAAMRRTIVRARESPGNPRWSVTLCRGACPGLLCPLTGSGLGPRARGRAGLRRPWPAGWRVRCRSSGGRGGRIGVICRHGIDGCVASRSSGNALMASPIPAGGCGRRRRSARHHQWRSPTLCAILSMDSEKCCDRRWKPSCCALVSIRLPPTRGSSLRSATWDARWSGLSLRGGILMRIVADVDREGRWILSRWCSML